MILQPDELVLLSLSPFVGLLFTYVIPRTKIKYIVLFASILTLPIFSGYDYVISWLYELNLTIIAGCVFCYLMLETKRHLKRILSSVLISSVLFFVLGYNAFIDAFAGNQYVEKTWKQGSYKVEYIRDQGFAGGPAYSYRISHCPIFVFFC